MLNRCLTGLLALLFLFFNQAFAKEALTYQETRIPLTSAGKAGLEALLVWPDDGKSHPVALINHGSPRDATARHTMSAIASLPAAIEFARRGFAVAYVLRRGYGSSGGTWAEDPGACKASNYLRSAAAATADLNAIIAYLNTVPAFDTHKILAVGVSAGGFSTVALAANPPPGLVAAISFAGGRGSKANDTVCMPDRLIAAFGTFGKTERIPMLWVYAKNDHFFNPVLARQLHAAFTAAGGQAKLLLVPAYGTEGHFLFSNAGIPTWTPLVDAFLKTVNLVPLATPLPRPDTPKLRAPTILSAAGKQDFARYVQDAPHKAFAMSIDGAYGWRTGQRTVAMAEQVAMTYCQQHTQKTCRIIASDNTRT